MSHCQEAEEQTPSQPCEITQRILCLQQKVEELMSRRPCDCEKHHGEEQEDLDVTVRSEEDIRDLDELTKLLAELEAKIRDIEKKTPCDCGEGAEGALIKEPECIEHLMTESMHLSKDKVPESMGHLSRDRGPENMGHLSGEKEPESREHLSKTGASLQGPHENPHHSEVVHSVAKASLVGHDETDEITKRLLYLEQKCQEFEARTPCTCICDENEENLSEREKRLRSVEKRVRELEGVKECVCGVEVDGAAPKFDECPAEHEQENDGSEDSKCVCDECSCPDEGEEMVDKSAGPGPDTELTLPSTSGVEGGRLSCTSQGTCIKEAEEQTREESHVQVCTEEEEDEEEETKSELETEPKTDLTETEIPLDLPRRSTRDRSQQVAASGDNDKIIQLLARIEALENKCICPCEAEKKAAEEAKQREEEEERLRLEEEQRLVREKEEQRQSRKQQKEQFLQFLAFLESKVTELDAKQICPCKKAEAAQEEEESLPDVPTTTADDLEIEEILKEVEIAGEDELPTLEESTRVEEIDAMEVFGEDEVEGEFTYDHGPSWVLAQITSFLSQFTLDDFNQLFALVRDLRDRMQNLELTKEEEAALMEQVQTLAAMLEAFKDQLSAVKTKADVVDDLKLALMTKAERKDLETKVEHTEYVSAVEDLSKSIQETIDALAGQVEKWERQNEENQRYLEGVLNEHVNQIKDYLQEKMGRYARKLNYLAKVQQDIMSMGSVGRPQLLRGQNCITCGAGIVMRTEGGFRAPIRALQPRSMRVRAIGAGPTSTKSSCCKKASHCGHSRSSPGPGAGGDDMSTEFYEALSARIGGEGKRHVGGSHTKTTADQRIIRTGDFKKDFLQRKPSS